MKTILLASALASGGSERGCWRAPRALTPWKPRLRTYERSVQPRPWPDQAAIALSAAGSLHRRAALLRRSGGRPLLIGGDHSEAIGFWSGIAAVCGHSLGMIWIDAHLDSHTPASSASQRLHGMPLAVLLGQGDQRWRPLLGERAIFSPAHTTIIAYRSYEEAEYTLLTRLGVTLISADELRRRGWPAVWRAARRRARQGDHAYGVSLDLDALSPHCAPGVSVPVPGGLDVAHLWPSWRQLGHDRHCKGLEIAEFNPAHDRRGRTQTLLRRLIAEHVPRRRMHREDAHERACLLPTF